MEEAILRRDGQIVDAGDPAAHQPGLVKLPKLIAIRAPPLAVCVMPFIGEAHRHAVLAKAPDFFDEPVFLLARPFGGEEGDDFRATVDEILAVPPLAVLRIGQGDRFGITAVPGVLGKASLLAAKAGGSLRALHLCCGLARFGLADRQDGGHALVIGGKDIARRVAQEMVVYYRRPGGQSQFSALAELGGDSTQFAPLLDWIRAHLDQRLTVETLAEQAAMSPRNFSRAFTREMGMSPAKAVERLRLEVARERVENSADPIEHIAAHLGFHDPERMRRAFLRAFGQPPQAMRRIARKS
eukprot:gene16778-16959_t